MCRSRWGEICAVRSHWAAWAGSEAVLVSDMVTNSYEESAPVIYLGAENRGFLAVLLSGSFVY